MTTKPFCNIYASCIKTSWRLLITLSIMQSPLMNSISQMNKNFKEGLFEYYSSTIAKTLESGQ